MNVKRLSAIALSLLLTSASVTPAQELGALAGAYIGPLQYQVGNLVSNSPTTLTFNAANAGWCARVMATDTRDFKSVAVNFSAATTPGTVTIRIETADATGNKPSGTLYDASATKQFTPSAGWNVISFDSLPTTGLTPGTLYFIVLIKDDAGTTCTLRSHTNASLQGNWPTVVLTAPAPDASTRTNFAESANTTPIAYFVLEDNALVAMGCCPAIAGSSAGLQSASHAIAQKVVLANDIVVRGVRFQSNTGLVRTGTPTANLRMRILDASNAAVSGTTVTIDLDTLLSANGRGLYIPFPPTTLAAGTYRVAFDSAGDGSNYFGFNYITLADAAFQGAGFCYSASTDMGTTFTWTDTTTRMLPFGLELDSLPATGSSGFSAGVNNGPVR